MIDEMSLGLAPVVVKRLIPIVTKLATDGVGVLVVEQFAPIALSIGQRAYVLSRGGIAYDGDCEALSKDPDRLLDEAKAKRIRNVFVVFHNPVYNRAGFAPIPEDTNPHSTLASYVKDFAEIIVFNGHVHTTEHFDVDGVQYFVMGGGGAEQDPILPGRTAIPRPAGYPPDLYWNGKPPIEEYNYFNFSVKPGEKTKVTLTRFRPTSSTPFEEVTLSKGGPAK
jgi:hypothetical protein